MRVEPHRRRSPRGQSSRIVEAGFGRFRWRLKLPLVRFQQQQLAPLTLRVTLNQPFDEVRELVELAAEGTDTRGLSIWVKNCSRAFVGRAYREAAHCVVRIGADRHFPIRGHSYPGLKTAPTYDIATWQEAVIVVTAHELRHQQQFRLGWPASEVDAERWALERLETYRALRDDFVRAGA